MTGLPAAAIALAALTGAVRAADRPNIIVFYTDDHGHADLGCQGVASDVKTPRIDALATAGARIIHGYTTAPQCVPSRGGLMTGRFQSRFGLEDNNAALDGFNRQTTIARRLQDAGYLTAQFGKWHLGPAARIGTHGFRHVFAQNSAAPFFANITVDGKDRQPGTVPAEAYHIDACSRAAAAVIGRYHDRPFFLYLAYRAPHVPLDPPQRYLDRFPGQMPERRRKALAMLSAVDDGVGLVTDTLAKHGLTEKTLVFLIGDNGAPLKISKPDDPGGGPGWDGSLNDPLNGEKGMLAEGGMHVPFVVSWPGTIPGGQAFPHPVSTLDVAATAAAVAKLTVEPGTLDGVDLIPHLQGKTTAPPHEFLCWRWISQSAIREGRWKLLRGGEREYLYDLESDIGEKRNLAAQHPDLAKRLRDKLGAWCADLQPPGFATRPMADVWNAYYDFYLDGKPVPASRPGLGASAQPPAPGADTPQAFQGWLARNGTLAMNDGVLGFTASDTGKGFLVRNGLDISGPADLTLELRAATAGPAALAWRTAGQKDFLPANRVAFALAAQDDWQKIALRLPATGKIVHLRLHLPPGTTALRRCDLRSADNQTFRLLRRFPTPPPMP